MAARPVEIELKLGVAPEAAPRVARHPAVLAAKRSRARSERLVATYFDTPDLALAGARLALRIRREGRAWIQTVKGPPPPGPGVALGRTEIESRLPPSERLPPLSHEALAQTPWGEILAKAWRKGALRPVFTTDYARTTVPLEFPDGTRAALCIDVGEIRAVGPARARRAPLCEIEIELDAGDPARLFELAQALATDLPLAAEPASKAERGYGLLRDTPAPATRAERVELLPEATAADALAAIVGECMRHVECNADGVLHRHDPEYVHQMRVGTRRLRSALALVRPCLPDEPLGFLMTETRWLAEALGEARDLDVLLDDTLPPILQAKRATALAALVAPLAAAAQARRRTARRLAREALRSPRYVKLLLALGAWRATPLLGAVQGTPGADALASTVRAFAADVLARRHRKLLRRGGNLDDATAGERHAARIAAKRMRYAAEFFASPFPDKRVKAFVEALARVQEVLGAGNDAAVALALASRLVGDASPATFALAGWAGAQGAGQDRAIAKAWARFVACRPYWD